MIAHSDQLKEDTWQCTSGSHSLVKEPLLHSHNHYGNNLSIYGEPACQHRRHKFNFKNQVLHTKKRLIIYLWVRLEYTPSRFLLILSLDLSSLTSRKTPNLF